jgi:hypothetical protein
VIAADVNTAALELAAERPLDAAVLNCHPERDNGPLVTPLRILQPHTAIILFSGYCGVPCHQLQLADAYSKRRDSGNACSAAAGGAVSERFEVQSWRDGQNVSQ